MNWFLKELIFPLDSLNRNPYLTNINYGEVSLMLLYGEDELEMGIWGSL